MKEELGSCGESEVKGGASSDFLLPRLLAIFRWEVEGVEAVSSSPRLRKELEGNLDSLCL